MSSSTNKWFVLIAASLGAFLSTVMGTSVNVALPSLVNDLETQFALVQWVVLSFLLTNAVLLPIVGRLADMLGKKTLFMVGYVVFTLGSLLCGLADGIYWLIGFRVVQGVGAALLTALGLAIVTDVFPDNERGKALGITGSVLSSGIVVGPTLGGFLIDALSWHWVFFVGVPIGIIGTLLTLRFVPAYEPKGGQHFDLPGAAVLFSCLLALLLALTLGQQRGFAHPLILGLFALSALLLALFIWLELRVSEPVIDLRLFRNADLSIGPRYGLSRLYLDCGDHFPDALLPREYPRLRAPRGWPSHGGCARCPDLYRAPSGQPLRPLRGAAHHRDRFGAHLGGLHRDWRSGRRDHCGSLHPALFAYRPGDGRVSVAQQQRYYGVCS